MVVFEDFWSLVANRGHVAHFYRLECEALWKNYTPAQQQAICDNIERKINSGAFVHFVPEIAIRENARRTKALQPTNLNGHTLDPKQHYVRAIYNGVGGLYTYDEAREFNMQILGDFKL